MQDRQRPYLPKRRHMKAVVDDDFFEQSVAPGSIFKNLVRAFLQKHIQLVAVLRIHKVGVQWKQTYKLALLHVEVGVVFAVSISREEAQIFCKPDDKGQMKISNLTGGFVERQELVINKSKHRTIRFLLTDRFVNDLVEKHQDGALVHVERDAGVRMGNADFFDVLQAGAGFFVHHQVEQREALQQRSGAIFFLTKNTFYNIGTQTKRFGEHAHNDAGFRIFYRFKYDGTGAM